MKIFKIEILNFRLLQNFSMDLEEELSLVIGKNNTGKTSIISVLDKFLNEKIKFCFDDLNISIINEISQLIMAPDIPGEFDPIGITLKLFIEYDENDDLSNVSRVLMDLDPLNNKIVLGFEKTLAYTDFLILRTDYAEFAKNEKSKVDQKKKKSASNLSAYLADNYEKYFKLHKKSYEFDLASQKVVEANYIDLKEESVALKDIISFKYIGARRDVTNKDTERTLSRQTSSLYRKKEDNNKKDQATEDFKDQLCDTDGTLSDIYKELFSDVIKKVQSFGGIRLNDTDISIVSTLQHRELLDGNTTVVYSHDDHKLPKHYNGLGYMNLISMIFEIEILVQEFKRDNDRKPADINLLVIEEPEAHTHPQMQYVFIKNIKKLLAEGIIRSDGINRPLQYIITTHSAHIVADSDFNDIKYLKLESKNNVIAKNLSDLAKEYEADPDHYQFLKQYLTISRAEIFFADKAVLIEGDTERILIPTFMRKVDLEEEIRLKAEGKEDNFLPLLSQNISIIEVGAYAHVFEKFIEFIGIKSLLITDIDAVKFVKQDDKRNDGWVACPVIEGTKTSNSAINHFLNGKSWEEIKSLTLDSRIVVIGNSLVCICYQQLENSYHARSFEDAFIHMNRKFLKNSRLTFEGLKNATDFDDDSVNAYRLAEKCIKKKTHFALDILFHSNEELSNWNIPAYIKNGLLWLKED